MSGTNQTPIESLRKWHALAERRRKHFAELHRSERWRRYYSEDAFRAHMKEVDQNVETWSRMLENARSSLPRPAQN